jgi:hypothetical protein
VPLETDRSPSFFDERQYHSPEDSDRILRLGHLTLNLAEYAGRGPVVRRYLLDSGKTNATLKVRSLPTKKLEGSDLCGFRATSLTPFDAASSITAT